MKKVKLTEPGSLMNECRVLTKEDGMAYRVLAMKHWVSNGQPILLPLKYKSKGGNYVQVQTPSEVKVVYQGRHLKLMVVRAKRWLKSNARPGQKLPTPPAHIGRALAVFQAADGAGFKTAMDGAVP